MDWHDTRIRQMTHCHLCTMHNMDLHQAIQHFMTRHYNGLSCTKCRNTQNDPKEALHHYIRAHVDTFFMCPICGLELWQIYQGDGIFATAREHKCVFCADCRKPNYNCKCNGKSVREYWRTSNAYWSRWYGNYANHPLD